MELLYSEISALMKLLVRKVEKVYKKHDLPLSFNKEQNINLLMVMFAPKQKQIEFEFKKHHEATFSDSFVNYNIKVETKEGDQSSFLSSFLDESRTDSLFDFSSLKDSYSLYDSGDEKPHDTSIEVIYGQRGAPPRDIIMEEKLSKWIFEQLERGNKINKNMLRRKAMQFSESGDFRGSRGWLRCFLRRHPKILEEIQKKRKVQKYLKKFEEEKKLKKELLEKHQVKTERVDCQNIKKGPMFEDKKMIKEKMYEILEEMVLEEDSEAEESKKEVKYNIWEQSSDKSSLMSSSIGKRSVPSSNFSGIQ